MLWFWGLFIYLLSSSKFKNAVLLPSTMYGVVSLLGEYRLPSLFQDLSFGLAECLLFACVPFTRQFRSLYTNVFISHSHSVSLDHCTRRAIFLSSALLQKGIHTRICLWSPYKISCCHTATYFKTCGYQYLISMQLQHTSLLLVVLDFFFKCLLSRWCIFLVKIWGS